MAGRRNAVVAGVATVVLLASVAAAYLAGRRGGSAMPGDATAATPGPSAQHPPIPTTGSTQSREGKVEFDRSREFVHYRVGNKNVKRIFADGDTLWVATSGGLIRYKLQSDEFKLFDVKNGLLSNGIFHVGRLGPRIVLGTYGGGMALMDPATETWETYNIPDGLGDAFVYDVLRASNGDVWIATWSGVNRVHAGDLKTRSRWELHTVETTMGGLPNDWVYGLAEGRDGTIWLATEGGLARYRNGTWSSWNHAAGLGADYENVKNDLQYRSDPSRVSQHHARQKEEMGLQKVDVAYNPNYIVSLAVDRDGVVWAGTWGAGLARFDGIRFTNYTVADGLPGNHVFMLHLDRGGQLWIGTNNGLARRLPNGKFAVMTTHDGLFSNAVFSMDIGPDGTLWVGGYGGVARIRAAPAGERSAAK